MGPPMSPALSGDSAEPSLTARALRPSVILTTVLTMLICGVMGMGIGIARFKEERPDRLPVSVGACQAFMIMASGSTIAYVFIHLACAIYNLPIGDVRPPANRLHAACFIVIRVTLLLWVVCIITTAVVVSRPGICAVTNQECTLQVLDLIAANLCFLGTGVIVTALEACKYPFEIPEAFTGVTCRVSSFGDDLFDRNMSAIRSFDSLPVRSREQSVMPQDRVAKEPSIEVPALAAQVVPGEYPLEHGLTQPLPPIQSQASAWSAEVNNLVVKDVFEREKREEAALAAEAGSKTQMREKSSTSHPSNRYRDPRRTGHRRKVVSPSSSISNENRRSPLSRMRSAEFPNITVQPELKYLPTGPQQRPASRVWQECRAPVPPPFSPPNGDMRQKENRDPYELLRNQIPGTYASSNGTTISRSPPAPITKRASIEIRIPGAYIDSRSYDDEKTRRLEEHARRVEADIAIRKQNYRMPRDNTKVHGVRASSGSNDPRQRYKEKRMSNHRARITTRKDSSAQETEEEIDIGDTLLRRITLVDNGPVPGKVFDPHTLRRYQ